MIGYQTKPEKKLNRGIYMIYYEADKSINNLVYIGASKNLKGRLTTHKRKLDKGSHPNKRMQRDYSNNPNRFKFRVLELIDDENKIKEREQFYINSYESHISQNGYNQTYYSGYSPVRKRSSIFDSEQLKYIITILKKDINKLYGRLTEKNNKILDLEDEIKELKRDRNAYKNNYYNLMWEPRVRKVLNDIDQELAEMIDEDYLLTKKPKQTN